MMLTPKEQMRIICKGVHQCVSREEVPTLLLEIDKDTVNDIIPQLIAMGYVKSRSEFIRLIKQGGIQINGEKMEVDELNSVLINFDIIKIGKKRFVKIDK